MLGRYPFVEPSRCRSRDVGEEQLRQLLAAGITVFVSLQVCAKRWGVVQQDAASCGARALPGAGACI